MDKRYLSGRNGGVILVEGNIKKVYEELAQTLVEWYQIDYNTCFNILDKNGAKYLVKHYEEVDMTEEQAEELKEIFGLIIAMGRVK